MRVASRLAHLSGIVLESFLTLFFLGLVVAAWSGSRGRADSGDIAESRPASSVMAVQGTTLVATIEGSISTQDTTFVGQRHVRSGIPGDPNCALMGQVGPRFYDTVRFFNPSPVSQKVDVSFISSCGASTFMAAYSPAFNPAQVCANFVASSGAAGSSNWSFTICPNTQFEIVVYGVEPGVTCPKYRYFVYDHGVISLGPNGVEVGEDPKQSEGPDGPTTDVKIVRDRRHRLTDVGRMRVFPEGITTPRELLPVQGTTLVATIVDSIDNTEPIFTGQRQFRRGIVGDRECMRTGGALDRFYDQVFFVNNSSSSQKVSVRFTSFCGGNTYMAAYSPRFTGRVCENYLASAGLSGSVNWDFIVCANSQFSIVVYGLEPDLTCSRYSYTATMSSEIVFLGSVADLSIAKSGPPGPVSPGTTFTYTISVANKGPYTARDVTISDPLPAGTTFALLSAVGTGLPNCTTPAVNSPGTVTCTLDSLSAPGGAFPNSISLLLRVNVSSTASGVLTNTATASRLGIDPNPSDNSSTVATLVKSPFDICLQDDSSGDLLRLDSSTGNYQFKRCRDGTVVAGIGTVTKRGCSVILDHTGADRKVRVQIDTCRKSGLATIQLLSRGTFTITDRDITNNSCACPGGG